MHESRKDGDRQDANALQMPISQSNLDPRDELLLPIISKEKELGESTVSRFERAQQMADWGDEYRQSACSEDIKKEFDFALAKAVIRLEQFEDHEYTPVDKLSFESDKVLGQRYKHISDFVSWAESYVDHRAPHQDAIFDENPSPLPLPLMRDMIAYNMSPIVMRLHDTRHIHFAIGHPQGPALYFMSARGENIFRFTLLESLFETVDSEKFLYPHEKSVRDYFRNAGFSNIEEAMIFAGRASPEKIEEMVTEMGIRDFIEEEFSREWRPPVLLSRASSDMPAELNAEIDAFVQQQSHYITIPKNVKYCAYSINRPSTASDAEYQDDPTIH